MSRQIPATALAMLGMILSSFAIGASSFSENNTQSASERPLTTYERYLSLAVAGDPTIQYFLGYMFFYGEGVGVDYDAAHYWFHQAAEEGDWRAQRDLGIFHARASTHIPEKFYAASEANLWFSLAAANPGNPAKSALAALSYDKFLATSLDKVIQASDGKHIGESIYQSSCAGCHGFGGHAAYPDTPSFARGERFEQSDAVLVASILDGRGQMPAWGSIMSIAAAHKVVSYIRTEVSRGSAQKILKSLLQVIPEESQLALGEQTYLNFCGGCHGFNGIAWYVNAPSFALRERMEKTDADLTNSIKNGRGAMPSWEFMLKPEQIEALVQFIRTLAQTYEIGITAKLRRPDQFLRFRPRGESGPNWTSDDLR